MIDGFEGNDIMDADEEGGTQMIRMRCIQAVTALLAASTLTGSSMQQTDYPQNPSDESACPIEFAAYERELETYRNDFVGMYSSNAMADTEPQMKIQEKEIQYDQQMAGLTEYSDLSGERLRYRVNLYGETMKTEINYYFCDDFTAVSVEDAYYSSWVLTPGYADVLYTTIDDYIIVDGTVYMVHDNGMFEKTNKEEAGILLPDEMMLP